MYISTFIVGFIIAFARQPKIAGVMFIIVPLIAIFGSVMTRFTAKYTTNALNNISEGGSLAEEVLSTVRTAKAFGSQALLGRLYDDFLLRARKEGYKSSLVNALGLMSVFFIIYSSYSLAFVWGVTLILRGETDTGTVINVFMSILIGAFSLAMMAPELQAVGKAVGAAAKIYDTIDRVPDIDSASDSGLKPSSIEGNITFHVSNFRVLKKIYQY